MDTKEKKELEADTVNIDYLYPNKNDIKFNVKLASKKEFFDTRYVEKN